MRRFSGQFGKLIFAVQIVICDCASFFTALLRTRASLAAENLFLRKQLALFQEREKKAKATNVADRLVLSSLACLFDWGQALVIVKPATLISWHRAAFCRFWRWKSRPVGRPPVPVELRRLIRRMATENPTWSEERIADELLLKLQIRISPRTVVSTCGGCREGVGLRISAGQPFSGIMRMRLSPATSLSQSRQASVSVALEIGSRRLVHFNVTAHPTAEWTVQQLREALPGDGNRKFLLHDRHKTFSASLDEDVESWGIHVLRSPVRMPTANAHCERLIGTIRRECLDYVIALSDIHLRRVLREWTRHYNSGRPHRSLGPGIPDPDRDGAIGHSAPDQPWRASRVIAKPILGGLHHEYRWENAA